MNLVPVHFYDERSMKPRCGVSNYQFMEIRPECVTCRNCLAWMEHDRRKANKEESGEQKN